MRHERVKVYWNQRVKVYWNLHRHCYSVMLKNKVIDHVDHIVLIDARFFVREKSRLRVLRERRKNVHAFVEGAISSSPDAGRLCDSFVEYDPYKFSGFVLTGDNTPLQSASTVALLSVGGHPMMIAHEPRHHLPSGQC